MTRCELILSGKAIAVDDCSNSDLKDILRHIFTVLEQTAIDAKIDSLLTKLKDAKFDVKYLVCNTVYDMRCISFLLSSTEENITSFVHMYDNLYLAFSYTYNFDVDYYSEYGDCFFEKREDNHYYRIS